MKAFSTYCCAALLALTGCVTTHRGIDAGDTRVLVGLNERAAGKNVKVTMADGTSFAANYLFVGPDSTTWSAVVSEIRRVPSSSISAISPIQRSRRSNIIKGAAVGAALAGTAFAISFGDFFIVPTTLGAAVGGLGGALFKRRSVPTAATITLAGEEPFRVDHLTLGADSASWAMNAMRRQAVATTSLSRVDLPRRRAARSILIGAGIGAAVLGGAAFIELARDGSGYEAYAIFPAGAGAILGGAVGAVIRGPRRVYLFNQVEANNSPGRNEP